MGVDTLPQMCCRCSSPRAIIRAHILVYRSLINARPLCFSLILPFSICLLKHHFTCVGVTIIKMKLTSSPKLNSMLFDMGIATPYQVVCHLPRKYDSFLYTSSEELENLQDKQKIVLLGRVVGGAKTLRFRSTSNTKFYFEDVHGNQYEVIAWNRPYLASMLKDEGEFTLQATYDQKKHCLNLINIKKGRIDPEHALVPVYSLPSDYAPHLFRGLVERSLEALKGKIYNRVPPLFVEKYRFINREDALRKCHFPTCPDDIHQGLRVLKYEEALMFCLTNQIIRGQSKSHTKEEVPTDRQKLRNFVHALPYLLTEDQKNAIADCLKDMESSSCMYRLLQGDVGTGKTLVAALLMYANATRNSQSAFMAPTDSLARQHYKNLKKMFDGTGLNVVLLVGNLSSAGKKSALEEISNGSADIVVGTHALFSKGVDFLNLGLAIIDEQHKFGVAQRARLVEKGGHVDVLLMSATPIPRTLTLTIYGDLDISTLTQFPSSKRSVKTRIFTPKASEIKTAVEISLKTGHRVYVVCPQIEEGGLSSVKTVYDAYAKRYPGKVALLHGKMDEDEKEAALLAFSSGVCPILVSTSVIEVGIDVKEANLMIVYDPTHFALSSLHQLRGRVGRDGSDASFVLAYGGDDEDELEKLNVLVNTDDGFAIAEKDLAMRGPGTIAGTRQSGLPDFSFVNVIDDFKMFEFARNDATYILNHPTEHGFGYLIKEAEKASGDATLA